MSRSSPAALKRQRDLRWYGLTPSDRARLLSFQNYECRCCSTPIPTQREQHADHAHQTGLVRGFLCLTCNSGLGKLRDSPARVDQLIAYLTAPRSGRLGWVLLAGPKRRRCPACFEVKPAMAYRRHRLDPAFFFGQCRDCYRAHHPFLPKGAKKESMFEEQRGNHLWRKYALTPSQAAQLRVEALGCCQACGAAEELVVDHNHCTGEVRGLLCLWCNTALGKGRGDEGTELLHAWAIYLRATPIQVNLRLVT